MAGHTVAIMQPYFFPYAGYFRLFAAVDEFIILDCVQFPRRGHVHRSELPGPAGDVEWLTLPLTHQPRETLIRDLAFADDARDSFDRRLARYPSLAEGRGPAAAEVRAFLRAPLVSPADYLEAGLRMTTRLLGLESPMRRSSELAVDRPLKGQGRIIAIARAAGASRYVNSPGGRALYDAAAFDGEGIELCFLPPYDGPFVHLLPALVHHDPRCIAEDVARSAQLLPA